MPWYIIDYVGIIIKIIVDKVLKKHTRLKYQLVRLSNTDERETTIFSDPFRRSNPQRIIPDYKSRANRA